MSETWKWFLAGMIVLAIASGLMALVTMPAHSQQQFCLPEAAMLQWAYKMHGQHPRVRMQARGGIEVIFLRDDLMGAWSLLRVENKQARLIGFGTTSHFDKGI